MTVSLPISRQVARRYLLGRQGLWPGRRWRGKQGAIKAILALQSVQMDPLVILARSHDLVLHARVLDYAPEHLETLMYKERRFFDYGGHLDIYPIEELPYWRVHMRHRKEEPRVEERLSALAHVIPEVRRRLEREGPLGSRDFEGTATLASYRGSKEAGVALYYLWLTGDLMTHSRRGSERIYDLAERIAPPHLLHQASEEETAHYFALKSLRAAGLAQVSAATSLTGFGLRVVSATTAKARLAGLAANGLATPVRVEGVKDQYYIPTDELPLVETLAAGKVPRAWQPLGPTTDDEVIFLSPLDNVLDRRRTKAVFDFDYLWEIYKKPEQRQYGPYTLPVLYGDRLVARLDAQLQRKSSTLTLRGFWPEHENLDWEGSLERALLAGLVRLAAFLGADQIEFAPLSTPNRSATALMSRIVTSFRGMPSAR